MVATKVLLFATHIHSTNGYCLVGHALAREMAKRPDIDLTYYGFQNFHKNPAHMSKRTLPPNVYIYDAFENENPKSMGFGFDQVAEFVTINKPDVCVIYNDMVVVSTILDKLKQVPNRAFKIIVYVDQVYLHQKKEFIKRLNEECDMVLAFTPFWQDCIAKQGITKPLEFLRHGFDPMQHFPVPKHLARAFFGLKESDFIILNLNRNQPRKRWDICLQAFAEVVSRHLEDPIKLLVATTLQGAWNLIEVYERELGKRGITLEEGMKHMILIDNPQQITDDEINILYNVADIGISTADGEGFGLCSFQQAACGIPQIVPAIGGFLDFFHKDNAIMIDPKLNLYIDNGRDGVGGESQLCDYHDFVDGIEAYWADKDLRERHGQRAREHILKNYKWSDIGDKLYGICKRVCGHPIEAKVDSVVEEVVSLKTLTAAAAAPSKPKTPSNIKERLRQKLKKKQAQANKVNADTTENIDIKSLLELKDKIDRLIEAKQA